MTVGLNLMRSQAAIGGGGRRRASVCCPRPPGLPPPPAAAHRRLLQPCMVHGMPNVNELQVLSGSYLNGAALGLPSTLFLAHFPSTTPVTLRNAADEEWGGKLTRKPLNDCNRCKLPACRSCRQPAR